MTTFYAAPSTSLSGKFDMRQERYREQLALGFEHPHDVCAVGFSAEEFRALCAKYNFDCDLSALP